MKIIFYCLAFCTIISSILYSQQDTVLAKIGPEEITGKQFKERFELTPQVYKYENNHYSKKEDLLYSLIAEKLWSLEASKIGLDTTEIMKTTFKALEDMYVRDALYKIEVMNKIKITDQEIINELKKEYSKLEIKTLYSADSTEIFNSYSKLEKGVLFDSLKTLKDEKESSLEVKHGIFQKAIEDSLFDLSKGQYTYPIKSDSGWFIFYLENKTETSFTSEDIASKVKSIKDKLEHEKAAQIGEEFLKNFFKGKQIPVDPELTQNISKKFISIVQERKVKDNIPDTVNVYLKPEDFLKVENEFGPDTLKRIFIKFETNPFTVEDFLRYFAFEGFYSREVSPETIEAKLEARIRQVIEDELLSREGYRRGLENLPNVQASINMWKDNYLAQLLKDKFIDSIKVTNEEVHKYYDGIGKEKNPNDVMVNVREILTDSLDVINKVMKELKKGADFGKLATIYTKRIWTRSKGGEFGFFPSSMYGDIGKIAATMKIGEIYGPIKTPNGFSLIKLIGKKEKDEKPTKTFAEMKNELSKVLLGKKRSDFFINYTVKLANKFGVSINQNYLSSIQVNDFNMYAYRYMGFGGRISAVPVTLPFVEWYKPWIDEKKVVP